HFTKDDLRGMCVFTRRQTSEKGQSDFHLSSLGVLLARSLRPRPRCHGPARKVLVCDLHTDSATQGKTCAPARQFLELRKARLADLGGAGTWYMWSAE
ncbi:hypothetical protein EDB84DRAFT_1257517, partial [Lactarius hengduanensis]